MARSGHKQDRKKSGQPDPREILQEACDRNTPICVIRPEQTGRVPMARGRLLALDKDRIDIERVQIPGLDVRFSSGDNLDAFFSIGRTLYHFRTKLLSASEPKRLNRRMVILGMSIELPAKIEQGDRRSLFRVPLSGREDRIMVDVWRPALDNDLPDDPEHGDDDSDMPALPPLAFNIRDLKYAEVIEALDHKPDYSGWVVDASEHGFGIRLEFVHPERFRVFDPLLVRLNMPGDLGEIVHLCEVRAKRAVGEDGTRLGVVIINEDDQISKRNKAAKLRGFLNEIQREHLRRMRNRAG